MGILWKNILVACVAAAALAACSGGNTGASTSSTSDQHVVTLLPEKDDSKMGSTVQSGASTVSCSQNVNAIELNVGAAKKGFSGKLITVKVENKETIIDWGGDGANAIVVNGKQWAYAGGDKTPKPTKTVLPHSEWEKPTNIKICASR